MELQFLHLQLFVITILTISTGPISTNGLRKSHWETDTEKGKDERLHEVADTLLSRNEEIAQRTVSEQHNSKDKSDINTRDPVKQNAKAVDNVKTETSEIRQDHDFKTTGVTGENVHSKDKNDATYKSKFDEKKNHAITNAGEGIEGKHVKGQNIELHIVDTDKKSQKFKDLQYGKLQLDKRKSDEININGQKHAEDNTDNKQYKAEYVDLDKNKPFVRNNNHLKNVNGMIKHKHLKDGEIKNHGFKMYIEKTENKQSTNEKDYKDKNKHDERNKQDFKNADEQSENKIDTIKIRFKDKIENDLKHSIGGSIQHEAVNNNHLPNYEDSDNKHILDIKSNTETTFDTVIDENSNTTKEFYIESMETQKIAEFPAGKKTTGYIKVNKYLPIEPERHVHKNKHITIPTTEAGSGKEIEQGSKASVVKERQPKPQYNRRKLNFNNKTHIKENSVTKVRHNETDVLRTSHSSNDTITHFTSVFIPHIKNQVKEDKLSSSSKNKSNQDNAANVTAKTDIHTSKPTKLTKETTESVKQMKGTSVQSIPEKPDKVKYDHDNNLSEHTTDDQIPSKNGSCEGLHFTSKTYTSSALIAVAVGGVFIGAFAVMLLFHVKHKFKKYVNGDYRRVPIEYDFELNPRFKMH